MIFSLSLITYLICVCFGEPYYRPGYHQEPAPLIGRAPYARTWHHMNVPSHRNSNPHVFEPDRIIEHFLNPSTWLEPFRPLFESRVDRYPDRHHEGSSEEHRPGLGGGISIAIGGGVNGNGNRWKPWTPVVTTYGDNYEPCRYGSKGGRKCHPGHRYPSRKPFYQRPGWASPEYPQQPVDPWNPGYDDHYHGEGCNHNHRGHKHSTTTVKPLESDRKDNETQVTESTKAIEQVPLNNTRSNTTSTDPQESSVDVEPELNQDQPKPNRDKVGFYSPNDEDTSGSSETGSDSASTGLPVNDNGVGKKLSPSESPMITTPKSNSNEDADKESAMNDDKIEESNDKKSVMNSEDISGSSSVTSTEASKATKDDDKSNGSVNEADLVGDESGTYLAKLAPSSSSPPVTTTVKSSSSVSMFSSDLSGSRGSPSLVASSSSSSESDILPGEMENGVYEKEYSKDEFIKHITSLNEDAIRKLTEKLGIKIRN